MTGRSRQGAPPFVSPSHWNAATLVSVTRFRARSTLVAPLFALHAHRAMAQLHEADGILAGAVQRDSDLAFWSMTVWRDARAMQAYATSGSHRAAMPHRSDWGVDASVVRWSQQGDELPHWSEAARRLRAEGRPSKLRHPGPHHADLSFSDPTASYATRL